MTNTFTFIGKINKVQKNGYEEKLFESGWFRKTVGFNVIANDQCLFVTAQGGMWKNDDSKNVIKTITNPTNEFPKGEEIVVNWADRGNTEIVSKVAYIRKTFIDLTIPNSEDKIKKEFISNYDFVGALNNLIESEMIKSNRFKVSGIVDFSYDPSKDKYYRSFRVTSVSIADPNEADSNSGKIELFLKGTDSYDPQPNEKGVIQTKTYIKFYDSSTKSNYFAPFPLSLHGDCAEDMKFKTYLEKAYVRDAIYSVPLIVDFISGASRVKLTEEQILSNLDDFTILQIELGIITKESVVGNISSEVISGERIYENRYKTPYITSKTKSEETIFTEDDLYKKPINENGTKGSGTNTTGTSNFNRPTTTTKTTTNTNPLDIFSTSELPFDI